LVRASAIWSSVLIGRILDETLPNVLTKVMIARVDVLCPRPKFRQTSKFEGTRVVLEDLAIDDWLFADHFVAAIAHSMIGITSRSAVLRAMYSASVVERAT
jgi:hypothetical protein